MEIKLKHILMTVAVIVGIIVLYTLGGKLVGNVLAKEYHVKQGVTGSLTVKSSTGPYARLFGDVEKYPLVITYYFSKDSLDGGKGDDANPISATFMGNSTADISGMIMVEMPSDEASRLELHRKYGSTEVIKMNLIRNCVAGALKQAGPMFRPEEAFSTRRPEFTQIMRDIVIDGIPETETTQDSIKEDDRVIVLDRSILKKDTKGNKILLTKSTLETYGIKVIDFVIKDFEFDHDTQKLITEKKIAQQKIVAARAASETAKQDALTAEELGKAAVAKAEAMALVEMKTAVVNAQRDAEVAKQKKIEADSKAAAQLSLATAEAQANRLKVSAGLTPQEKADYEMRTKIGVAEQLAKWTGPSIVTMGGNGGGGEGGMMNALGIKSMMEINDRLNAK